jgi:hypothetical protein
MTSRFSAPPDASAVRFLLFSAPLNDVPRCFCAQSIAAETSGGELRGRIVSRSVCSSR